MVGLVDTFYAMKFLRLLTIRWKNTDAYKLGIIDGNGKQLVKVKDFKTDEQKRAYSIFNRMVFNIKRLLQKIPFGASIVGSLAVALYLIKEDIIKESGDVNQFHNLMKTFEDYLQKTGVELPERSERVLTEGSYLLSDSSIVSFNGENLTPIDTILGVPLYMVEGRIISKEHIKDYAKRYTTLLEDISTANVDMGGGKKYNGGQFGGHQVFKVPHDTFTKCRLGKHRYAHYKKYFENEKLMEVVKNFSKTNRKKAIILQDETTGAMLFFKRAK